MKHTARCFLALFLVTGTVLPVLAIPPFGLYSNAEFSPVITIEHISDQSTRLTLNMEDLPDTGTVNLAADFPGLWGEMNPTGYLMPRFSIFLALPATGNPSMIVESWNTRVFTVLPPRTVPDNNPRPASITIGTVGILGGARLVPLTFRPISYVNGASSCSVVYQASVRIDMDAQQGLNPVINPRPSFSQAWQEVFRSVVLNWEDIPNIFTTSPSHILMVVPQFGNYNFMPHIQDYVTWKEQCGCIVSVVPSSVISTAKPTAAQIRQLVIDSLLTSPPVDFVLLAGDETRLSTQSEFTDDPPTRFSTETVFGNYTSENYFSTVEGTDFFPDVFVGRWVVDLNDEVRKYVQRIINHERNTFASDSARFNRCVVAADMETPSQRQTKRDVRAALLGHGFAAVDSIWGNNVNPTVLTNKVNSGIALLNYRGTGWSTGWAGINFWVNHIDDISNAGKLPVITGIGCGVCIFGAGYPTGFAETWMTSGTITEPRGAAGFIGPCWNTHTVYNDCLDSCLYRSWLDYGVQHLSSGLVAGKMMTYELMAQFMSESGVEEVVKTMFQQYMVQGDPSLQIFTRMPYRLDVTVPSALPTMPSTIPVTVNNASAAPAESLWVTLWRGAGDFESQWIAPGQTTVNFPFNPADADTVVITVTGKNVLAFQQRIPDAADVPSEQLATLPGRFELAQNYPNPFNAETIISFAVPRAARVTLEVFDILGRRIATLTDGQFSAGWHHVTWNGVGDGALSAGSGIYFYRLTTPDGVQARKMILLR